MYFYRLLGLIFLTENFDFYLTLKQPIAAINKPVIALTPTGTPTYAQAARSRPTSECVPNEPVVEDPEIEDVIVEDVVEEAPKVSQVQAEPAAPAEAKAPEGK